MTPIVSIYDCRLATLIGVSMEVIKRLAIHDGVSPNEILADNLFLATKHINTFLVDMFVDMLMTDYPLLSEAIR